MMWTARIYWFWYGCGLLLMLFYHVPAPLAFANPLFLLLYAYYAWTLASREAVAGPLRSKLLIGTLLIGAASFALERVGVVTGYPFGNYEYGSELGFSVLGVPLAIAAAWMGILLNVSMFAPVRSRRLRSVVIGLWAAGLDLVLDPVAHEREWWTWAPQAHTVMSVPLTNYAAWFAAAMLFSWLLPVMKSSEAGRRRAIILYQSMLLMFGLLALKQGLWAAFAISIAAIALAEMQGRRAIT